MPVGEFIDRLGQWDFTELLLKLLRDDYGKDVDGAIWDILDAGSRTGSGSGAGATGAGEGFAASAGASGSEFASGLSSN